MCDFSLQSVQSRDARVGDKLITRNFGTGTRGFADISDCGTAVCVKPGTEIAFEAEIVECYLRLELKFGTAIFRQVNLDSACAHHDALEFPDGRIVLLTLLCEGQEATVLQLPAQPTTVEEEAREPARVAGFA